jgi:hypothetical protein
MQTSEAQPQPTPWDQVDRKPDIMMVTVELREPTKRNSTRSKKKEMKT